MRGNSHVRFGAGDEETCPGNGVRRFIPTLLGSLAFLSLYGRDGGAPPRGRRVWHIAGCGTLAFWRFGGGASIGGGWRSPPPIQEVPGIADPQTGVLCGVGGGGGYG